MKFAHVLIQVRNLDKAIAFYESALGLKVVDRHVYPGARIAYLRSHDFELELLAQDEWPYENQPEPGRGHIAFTVDDLVGEHARIKTLGVEVDPAITDYAANGVHQTRYFYFHDPEGNQIEFLEPTGRYGQGGTDR